MILPPDPHWTWYTEVLRYYTYLLRSHTPFAVANYGDGEWGCILGEQGENVNGEKYVPELQKALQQTLTEPVPRMLYGMNPGKRQREDVRAWLEAHNVDVPMVFKETLPAANVNGQLAPFLRAVRDRDVVLVGPPHLADLPVEVLGEHGFIGVSPSRAWREVDRVLDEIAGFAVAQHLVILVAAGMGSNLLIHRLCESYGPEGTRAWIDVGACLDPYVGRFSRKGYRKESFQDEAMERNLS